MYYMIGYDRCSTCIKAMKHLKEKNISFEFLDVKKNPPTQEQLYALLLRVQNKDLFWNTSGKLYREYEIKSKKDEYSKEKMAILLSEETMLIKRPILYNDDCLIIGYKKDVYENL